MTPSPLAREGWGGNRARYLLAGLGVAGLAAASLLVLLLPIPYAEMGNYGYVGVFVVTLIATGAVIAPVPYVAAIVIAGSFLDPLAVALVAGVAAAVGELVGFGAGVAGRGLLPEAGWKWRLENAMRRFGAPVVFVASLVPNPLFDAVGVAAGAARTPIWVFLISCFFGKTLRFWALAAAGGPLMGDFLG